MTAAQLEDRRHRLNGTMDLLGSMMLAIKDECLEVFAVALENLERAERAEARVRELETELEQKKARDLA